jgi:hypothetical protein
VLTGVERIDAPVGDHAQQDADGRTEPDRRENLDADGLVGEPAAPPAAAQGIDGGVHAVLQ